MATASAIPAQRPARADGRLDLEAALAGLRGRKRAVVLMHDNPDPDCMAAAECMRALLRHELGADVTVAYGGFVGRAENRALVKELGLEHEHVERLWLDDFDLVALVDTQPETGNNSLPVNHTVDIVVDHHPARPSVARAGWCDIRQDVGASTTIAFQYLVERGIAISEALATCVLYAIKSETRDLLREASPAEHVVYATVMKSADFDKLGRIAQPKVPAAHFEALDRALRATEVRGPLVAACLGRLAYPDLVAEIADLLMRYEGATWVLCVGAYEEKGCLSIRTDDPAGRAGSLIRRIVGTEGAAGGHGAIAGGRLFAPIVDEQTLLERFRWLVGRMCVELDIEPTTGRPLITRT